MPTTPAHLTVHELLQALETGQSTHRLASRVLAHVRSLCPECDRIFREFETARDRRSARRDYSQAFRSAQDAAAAIGRHIQEDETEARRQAGEIIDADAGERLAVLEGRRSRFRSPLLVSLLVEEARSFLKADPVQAVEILEAAEVVCARISRPDYGEAFVERLLIQVEAQRANALRVRGELLGADLLWRSVRRRLLSCPLVDPAEEADLASLEASLRQDQRRFDEAEYLLAAGERLFRNAGDAVGVGKILTKRGMVLHLSGQPEPAIEALRQAAKLLDGPATERLYLMTQHNQALALLDLGKAEEAQILLDAQSPRYAIHKDQAIAVPRQWVQGRIAHKLGRVEEAASILAEVRNYYLEKQLGLDAALLTLDLADLYLSEGKRQEVKRLAGLMEAIFRAQGVHAEAIRALRLFEKAGLAETLTLDLIARLRRYLELAGNDPSFRFDPGTSAAAPPPPSPRRAPAPPHVSGRRLPTVRRKKGDRPLG